MTAMDIRNFLKNNRMITDGAMGTWYDRMTGYNGELAERGNVSHPDRIREIHCAYIKAGAQLIRTNTFAVNSMFFDTDEIPKVLTAAWENAKDAVEQCAGQSAERLESSVHSENSNRNVWIAADMGPIDESETRSAEDVRREYRMLCRYFIDLGAKIFVFETLSELRPVLDAAAYIKEQQPDAFIIAQFSFNRNGYTRSGMGIGALLSEIAAAPDIDAVGFNCGVGPLHLYELLKDKAFPRKISDGAAECRLSD